MWPALLTAGCWCPPHLKSPLHSPSRSHRLLDTVRRSLVTPNLEIQDGFVDTLLSSDEIEGVRVKSTMADAKAQVKQSIVNVRYTPKTTGFRPRVLVCGDIASDPQIKAFGRELQKANYKTLGVTVSDVNAALKLFEAPAVAKEPVGMIIELQLYIDYFLEARKICHIW